MCGVIVVDTESFQSTWHGCDAYVHDHCLRYLHNYALFYQLLGSNLFTHRNICYLERSHKWNLCPPGLFSIILISLQLAISRSVYFAIFTFQSIKKIPKIFILLSLSDLTFASGHEGIDNPFIALVARFLFVCAAMRDLRVVPYWIDTLVLKNWGKYLRYSAPSSLSLWGKPT